MKSLLSFNSGIRGVEQKIEQDGRDSECEHALFRLADAKSIIGTARLFFNKDPIMIGRVAVAVAHRKRGYGRLMMMEIQKHIGSRRATIHAQDYIKNFYAELGWRAFGKEFMEANILHISMCLNMTPIAAEALIEH